MVTSHVTPDQTKGIGAGHHCDLESKRSGRVGYWDTPHNAGDRYESPIRDPPDMRFTVYAENDAFTGFIEEFGILAGQPNQHV